MIKLYQYPSIWDLPNVSPFCLKLETYLRMAKLPYEVVKVSDPRKAPLGKLPFINDDGVVIADSSLIIHYLKNKYGDPLDAALTPLQAAQALAVQRLMEEHLYWVLVYTRWINPLNWPRVKKDFFAKSPFIVRMFISELLRKQTKKVLYAQGIGRHAPEIIEQMGVEDLTAIHAILAEHDFLMGNEPTTIDACAYAFLANILYSPLHSRLSTYAKSQATIINYCERIRGRYF